MDEGQLVTGNVQPQPEEPRNTVQRVCSRPLMYTNGGTLAEVLALFAEYEFGVLAVAASPSDDSPALTIQ